MSLASFVHSPSPCSFSLYSRPLSRPPFRLPSTSLPFRKPLHLHSSPNPPWSSPRRPCSPQSLPARLLSLPLKRRNNRKVVSARSPRVHLLSRPFSVHPCPGRFPPPNKTRRELLQVWVWWQGIVDTGRGQLTPDLVIVAVVDCFCDLLVCEALHLDSEGAIRASPSSCGKKPTPSRFLGCQAVAVLRSSPAVAELLHRSGEQEQKHSKFLLRHDPRVWRENVHRPL